jgi:hypothetical protein
VRGALDAINGEAIMSISSVTLLSVGGFVHHHFAEAATVAALFVAIFGAMIWQWLRRPILRVHYEAVEPYCRTAPIETGDPSRLVQTHWLRVRVTNEGRSTAKRCKPKSVGIYDTDGSWRADFDSVVLQWSATPVARALAPMDLAPKEQQYIDVLFCREDQSNVAVIAGDQTPAGHRKVLLAPSRCRIRVAVYADNTDPAGEDFDVAIDGSSLGLSMRRARGNAVFEEPVERRPIDLSLTQSAPINTAIESIVTIPATARPRANSGSRLSTFTPTAPTSGLFDEAAKRGTADPRYPDTRDSDR